MTQPKYRLEDLNLKSDKEYLDIKEQLIGFLIDKDIEIPFSIKRNLEKIINNMLSENDKDKPQEARDEIQDFLLDKN